MPRLRIRLREAIEAHQERTGSLLTHAQLAKRAGLSPDTLKKISNTRRRYNATLETVERIAKALGVSPLDLLDWS